MKKNILKLFAFLGLVFLFSSCYFMGLNTDVTIIQPENGRLEVKLVDDSFGELKYEITAFPDNGYELLSSNIFITTNDKKGEKKVISNIPETNCRFIFTCDDSNLIITGLFTKIAGN